MRVLVFGTFDPLHQGHVNFFKQARALGDSLLVVVARDSWIKATKERRPRESEQERLEKIIQLRKVDEVVLGDEWPAADPYRLLRELDFDILALGYDQTPDDDIVRRELAAHDKGQVKVVRLAPHQPEKYKSSRL